MKSVSRVEKMTASSLNGAEPNNGESAIVAALSSMSELLVSSITSNKSTTVFTRSDDGHH